MKRNKDVEIKARITRKMRAEIESIADSRGETLSLIVREAISEYLAKRRSGHFLEDHSRSGRR